MFQTYHFTFDEVKPDQAALMGYLQVPDEKEYAVVKDAVDAILPLFEDTQEIVGGYQIADSTEIDMPEGALTCHDISLHTGRRICGYMKDSEEFALFLCTAGCRFTRLSHQYQSSDDLLNAFIVESIGSATVENAMDKIQQSLEQQMQQESKLITNRYSPGYCDWPLSDQHALFTAIGPNPTAISLTESSLMQPIKSVSGIIGIGAHVKKRPYGCSICNSPTCVYRHIINRNKSQI